MTATEYVPLIALGIVEYNALAEDVGIVTDVPVVVVVSIVVFPAVIVTLVSLAMGLYIVTTASSPIMKLGQSVAYG